MSTQHDIPGICKAVKAAGSQTELADKVGVTQQVISKWVRVGFVPLNRAVELEELYDIPRRELISPKLRDLLEPVTF